MHEILLSLAFALKSMMNNAGRTALTLSGIVIGTVAIVVIASLGDALERYVLEEIQSYGNNTIQVEVKVPSEGRNSSGNSRGIAQGIQVTTLTLDDAEAIKKIPNVSRYYAGIVGQALASYHETNKQVFLLGATAAAPLIDRNIKLSEGGFYTDGDDLGSAPLVVLGSNVKDAFFGLSPAVGKTIRIKGLSYRVIGVLAPRGATGFVNFDDFAYVPLRTMQKRILGVDYASFISVSASDESRVEETALDIGELLRERHDIRKSGAEDYSVTTIKEAQQLVQTVFGAVRLLLVALASISLVVGGVGILNVMFVSVAERTGEIGLRKAVGARSKDILRQFLVESVLVAIFGGVFGLVIAYGAILLIGKVVAAFGFSVLVGMSVSNVMLAFGFSVIAGVVFGTYPAWKASRIDPIRAIREG